MLSAFTLSLRQLTDRAVLAVIAKSLALTLLLFALFGVGLWYGIDWLATRYLAAGPGWGAASAVAALLLFLICGWLLFRAVAIAVVGIFADEVVQAVEAKHYPEKLKTARDVPLGRSALMGLGSAARAIGINLLLVPLYVFLFFTAVGTPIAFFTVNAWLLGRDLGDMVAARHMQRGEMRDWRRSTRSMRFVLGAAGTGLLMVPLFNFVAPVIAAAMATHMFHRRNA